MNLPQALLRAYRLTSAGGRAADLVDAGAEHTEEEDQARWQTARVSTESTLWLRRR